MTLTASGITVTLGGRHALDGVDANFARGRVGVILGPNGAGKSTLLSVLAGLRVPGKGAVEIDGRALTAFSPVERANAIGFLPQSAELHWDLAVGDLVALGRSARRGRFGRLTDLDRLAIDAALDATDTRAFLGRNAASLSGGERARVLLARVLAGAPEWILADEPLANLDPAHQIEMLATLRAAARAGAGVVIVLHDLTLAHWIADDVLLLKDARVVAHGAAAVLAEPGVIERVYGIAVTRVSRADGPDLLVPLPPD